MTLTKRRSNQPLMEMHMSNKTEDRNRKDLMKVTDTMMGPVGDYEPKSRQEKQWEKRSKATQNAYNHQPKDKNAFFSDGEWWTLQSNGQGMQVPVPYRNPAKKAEKKKAK